VPRPRINLIANKSSGARNIVNALRALGAETTRSSRRLEGAFNIGWGRPGGDLNPRIPPNKLWELQTCRRAGVQTVPFVQNFLQADGQEGTWLGRLIHHTKGRDIVLHRPGEPAPRRDFWTRLINKSAEYRIHVFQGLAVRSGTKLPEPDADRGIIWNLDNRYLLHYEYPAPRAAKDLAKAAVAACGLDFAAVDVLQDMNGILYVLELNTAPGLHGNTTQKYAEKILAAAKRRQGNE